ncbi:pirin family protein [Rhodohalobacter halophilus]|uniref:pirin family protein n=1 Tax=Rhodohalobacter halophilus TaxID=1812810 RepID=UPI00083FB9AA|nr:pirin-like C-terminal cupin domain-containing protein [Rhodohalobacter halophilus]
MIQFHEPDQTYSLNQWRLLAGSERSEAPMKFRSEVLFYDVRLEKENSLQSPNLNGKTGLLYVFSGNIKIENSDEIVKKGDSVVIKDEQLDLISREDSDLVFFVLDENAPFSRNGLFAK